MKKLLILTALFTLQTAATAAEPLYKNPKAPIETRVSDLVGKMTTTEKIGQLCCPLGWEMYTKTETGVVASDKYKELMAQMPIGSFWAVLRADPWTQKTLETGLNPTLAADALNALQKYAVQQTRLGIPILFAEECPHGHMAIGATVFPNSVAQASTWNEDLIKQMGEAIAGEARAQGANIGYGPVLDIARDPRWSRIEESFGEDPVLTGTLGTAFVRGMQGESQSDGKHLFVTLKHFAAYGIPEGGHNGERANVGPRQLFSDYLAPFKQAITKGKAATIMTSYNSIDGIPCTANRFLLDTVLRQQWGFDGFVYSDLVSVDGIASSHRIAPDMKSAAAMAINAGVDMDLGGNAYGKNLQKALDDGLIDEATLNRAVANVLRLKFKMGLFENPYVDAKNAAKIVRSAANKATARKVAQQGTVLLKNNNILPLDKNISTIAVIGPNADMIYNQLGDYTAPQNRAEIITVLDGIKAAVSPSTKVIYAKGCAIRDIESADIESAVAAARSAQVAIVVVGGSSARDFKTKYISTGAAIASSDVQQAIPDMDCGEGYDRSTLTLLGKQQELINAVAATGTPMVVVYIQGRPLNMNQTSAQAAALLTAWYPGEQGGAAIAEIIFGDCNPSGKLPISIPKSEGQLPLFYSQGNYREYIDEVATPLYPFGFGLSYTTFGYSDLKIEGSSDPGVLQKVSCTVTNTGNRSGQAVVQLYICDIVASATTPPIELKAFQKIELVAGESRRVTFNLGFDELALYNRHLQQVVEKGQFKVMVGSSSRDIELQGVFTL